MRVYELAKQLGMESRILISELVKLGIEVTSHSNALEDGDAERAISALQGKSPESSLSGGGTKKSSSVKSTKAKGAGKGGNRTSGALGLDEPPKPEKKQILFKRKKEQEEVPPQETSFPSEGGVLEEVSATTPELEPASSTELEKVQEPLIAAIAPLYFLPMRVFSFHHWEGSNRGLFLGARKWPFQHHYPLGYYYETSPQCQA